MLKKKTFHLMGEQASDWKVERYAVQRLTLQHMRLCSSYLRSGLPLVLKMR